MKRVLVIADDLSGAAEIAGISARFGLPTHLLRGGASGAFDGATVIDTDSRDRSASEAIEAVGRCITNLHAGNFDLVFKKTDSAFRGHIRAETTCMLDLLGLRGALLVPHNPSRRRIVSRGQYFIDGVPLNQTPFANDPVYPARSADVLELLGPSQRLKTRFMNVGDEPPGDGLSIGAATTIDDVRHWANSVRDRAMLPVGAADFFTALLEAAGVQPIRRPITHLPGGTRLFICGSASQQTDALVTRARAAGAEVCIMPDDPQDWHRSVLASLQHRQAAVAVVGRPVDPAPGAARRIERILAELAQHVLAAIPVQYVMLEGGATASAICHRMEWNELEICGELATGVVQMRTAGGQSVVVKPGSYPWPEAVWH